MDYCGPRGLALSAFLDWDRGDQDAALAWSERERATCGNCGSHPDDFDPEKGGDRLAYQSEVYVCLGCAAKESADKQAEEHRKKRNGVRVRLRRNMSLPIWRPFRHRD